MSEGLLKKIDAVKILVEKIMSLETVQDIRKVELLDQFDGVSGLVVMAVERGMKPNIHNELSALYDACKEYVAYLEGGYTYKYPARLVKTLTQYYVKVLSLDLE